MRGNQLPKLFEIEQYLDLELELELELEHVIDYSEKTLHGISRIRNYLNCMRFWLPVTTVG